MLLESLSKSLRGAVRKVVRANRIDKKTVEELVRDIQRALIQADVKISLVKELSNRVRERALRETATLNPRAHVVKVVYEELLRIVGRSAEIPLKPQKIIVFGLNGSGKTLSCAKLALFFKNKGLKPAVICADVYRPLVYAIRPHNLPHRSSQRLAQTLKQHRSPSLKLHIYYHSA